MKQEIEVVTAFFNINRDTWKQGFGRTEQNYFDYFKLWARVQNKIVAYVESEEMKNKILEYRSSLGLGERTKVIVIPDCTEIDCELFSSISKATDNKVQQLYRLSPKNPEVWNPKYDYIMLLKMWCVSDAVKKGLVSGMVAWVDFGYNHGGSKISAESDFNFKWEYDFPEKINLFLIQELDTRPIFEVVFNMDTYIMGMCIVGVDYLWDTFWKMMRENMICLNKCGITDDDQNVILMCYRQNPDIFATHRAEWHDTMKHFGSNHLKYKTIKQDSYLRKSLRKLRYSLGCFQYSMRLLGYIRGKSTH